MARGKRLVDLAGSGDDGTTGLLGGGRAPKDDLRLEVYGTVDEASSALGLAKALCPDKRVRKIGEELQRGLYKLGAELATNPRSKATFARVEESDVGRVEELMRELEREVTIPKEFILPGTTPASAALDLSRTVARRAERLAVRLAREGGIENPQALRWLNRLSLLLFVLARYDEHVSGTSARPARSGRGNSE
jgi:cob(I)alamin adenosyltransferase